jgi:hypothetical protein
MLRFLKYIFAKKMEEKFGDFDSKHRYVMPKTDHNIDFRGKLPIFLTPRIVENRQKLRS